jgi:hypothetical protein
LANFDQLPPRGPLGAGKCTFGGRTGRNANRFGPKLFDQPVEDPSTFSEISGLRPVNFDPSTSLRALPHESLAMNSHVIYGRSLAYQLIPYYYSANQSEPSRPASEIFMTIVARWTRIPYVS